MRAFDWGKCAVVRLGAVLVVALAAALGGSGLAWAAGSMSSGMPTAGGGMSVVGDGAYGATSEGGLDPVRALTLDPRLEGHRVEFGARARRRSCAGQERIGVLAKRPPVQARPASAVADDQVAEPDGRLRPERHASERADVSRPDRAVSRHPLDRRRSLRRPRRVRSVVGERDREEGRLPAPHRAGSPADRPVTRVIHRTGRSRSLGSSWRAAPRESEP